VREGGLSFRTLELRDGDLDELTEGMLDEEDELTEEGVDEELEEWLIPYRFSSTVSKPCDARMQFFLYLSMPNFLMAVLKPMMLLSIQVCFLATVVS